MFNGFTPATIDFLYEIRINNNKPWFEANKTTYQQTLYHPMKALAQDIFSQVTAAYPNHGFINKVARIYKDARRVGTGEPYKTSLWLSIERPTEDMWSATPVFWFEIHPEQWTYGLGYYQAKALTMEKFRARLDKNPQAFEKLLKHQGDFALEGDEYKRRKIAPTPTLEGWYNRKSFSLIKHQPNGAELYSPHLASRIATDFQSLMPLYDYFITLDQDPNPRDK